MPKCWGVVQPYIPKYFPAIVQLTSPSLPLVCNNAVWVIGEVVAQVGPITGLLHPSSMALTMCEPMPAGWPAF